MMIRQLRTLNTSPVGDLSILVGWREHNSLYFLDQMVGCPLFGLAHTSTKICVHASICVYTPKTFKLNVFKRQWHVYHHEFPVSHTLDPSFFSGIICYKSLCY